MSSQDSVTLFLHIIVYIIVPVGSQLHLVPGQKYKVNNELPMLRLDKRGCGLQNIFLKVRKKMVTFLDK